MYQCQMGKQVRMYTSPLRLHLRVGWMGELDDWEKVHSPPSFLAFHSIFIDFYLYPLHYLDLTVHLNSIIFYRHTLDNGYSRARYEAQIWQQAVSYTESTGRPMSVFDSVPVSVSIKTFFFCVYSSFASLNVYACFPYDRFHSCNYCDW